MNKWHSLVSNSIAKFTAYYTVYTLHRASAWRENERQREREPHCQFHCQCRVCVCVYIQFNLSHIVSHSPIHTQTLPTPSLRLSLDSFRCYDIRFTLAVKWWMSNRRVANTASMCTIHMVWAQVVPLLRRANWCRSSSTAKCLCNLCIISTLTQSMINLSSASQQLHRTRQFDARK